MSDLRIINLLLIEDDPDDAQFIKNALAKSSLQIFNIAQACTLKEGVAILSIGKIDAVLLDLNLPDVQGKDTLKELLRQNFCVPIVVMSGINDETLMIEIVKEGIQDYIVKGMVDERMIPYFIRSSIERYKFTQKQRNKESCILNLIENNADGILIVDCQGNVRFTNPAAIRLFGRPECELVGAPFGFPLVTSESTELELIRPDSSIITVEARVSEATWEGQAATQVSLRDITDRVNYQKELQTKLMTDEMTGLYNRRGFIRLAYYHLKFAKRSQYSLMVFFFDVDKLKQINDNFGHEAGDQAIIATAEILKRIFRETDIIARLGGDEFVVLAINANLQLVNILENRVQKSVTAFNSSKKQPFQLSISWGFSYSEDDPHTTIEELVRKADVSMYMQKTSKKHDSK